MAGNTKPTGGKASGQFINIQKLHVAKLLTDSGSGATYDEPVDLGKVLRSIDIAPSNSQAELYADGQAIDTATSTASYDLTFETAALPLEYMAYLLGHKFENGTMIAGKDDEPPYFAVMFQSDKRNGGVRYTKFYKVQFAEPAVKGSTKEANITYQTPTLTAKAIYRLSDGRSYCYADTEDASFGATTALSWYLGVDLPTLPALPDVSDWADSTPYAVGDIVNESGDFYVCKAAHTSSSSFAVGTDWQKVADWAASTSYDAGAFVVKDGELYRALIGFTSGTTFNSAKWQKVS